MKKLYKAFVASVILMLTVVLAVGAVRFNNTPNCMTGRDESEVVHGFTSDGTPMITSKKDSEIIDGAEDTRLCDE